MTRIFCILALVLVGGCRDGRCEVERRMNCEGHDAAVVDAAYDRCLACDEVVSPVFREMGDCWSSCVATKLEYQCTNDEPFWDDACALECTGESSVSEATFKLVEMETHRLTLSTCRGG